MTDFTAMTTDQLDAKRKWYAARAPRFDDQIAAIDAELTARTTPRPSKGTVVANHYKERYGKDRGCGDWLHQFLASKTLDSDRKLIVSAFDRLLEANGIDPHGWNRTTSGWQGRLRMSGRRCLETVAKKTGQIQLADGTAVSVPPGAIATKPQVNA